MTVQKRAFSWSFSALKNWETCPKRYYHYDIAKTVKEPESGALREGHELHAAFDARIKSKTPLPLGLGHNEPMLARVLAAEGQTYSERKLAISSNYQPVSWYSDQAWYRGVLDCTKIRKDSATVLDWKSGRPGVDTTQLQLSAALVFHSAPQVNTVRAALVFVNHDKVESEEYVRSDLTTIWGDILPRVKKLQRAREEQEYPPKPGGLCKRWCQVVSCPHYAVGSY